MAKFRYSFQGHLHPLQGRCTYFYQAFPYSALKLENHNINAVNEYVVLSQTFKLLNP